LLCDFLSYLQPLFLATVYTIALRHLCSVLSLT
jgi:hypothetical protein